MKQKAKDPKQASKPQGEAEHGSAGFNPMMMMGMMKKMMAQLGSSGEDPMAMMQKMMVDMGQGSEAGGPMQNMMGMCMGMCAEMLDAVQKTASMAALATPELHTLFSEWMQGLEREAVAAIKDKGQMDAATLAAALKITEASATYLIAHLAGKGKAVLTVRISTTD